MIEIYKNVFPTNKSNILLLLKAINYNILIIDKEKHYTIKLKTIKLKKVFIQ